MIFIEGEEFNENFENYEIEWIFKTYKSLMNKEFDYIFGNSKFINGNKIGCSILFVDSSVIRHLYYYTNLILLIYILLFNYLWLIIQNFALFKLKILFQKILFKLMEIFLLKQFASLHFVLFYQILKEIIYLILFLHFQIKHIDQNLNIKMMKFLNFVNFAFLKQK